MKVTDSETIKNSENNLIDGLIGELDWQVIETLLREKYHLRLHDDVAYTSGDIIVHDKKIAYKLDFDVRVTLSLYVGRDGECVDIRASGSGDDDVPHDFPSAESNGPIPPAQEQAPELSADVSDLRQLQHQRKTQVMASHIADIINEIND
ncbi:hypothetical protein JCM14469_26420 [Desulfatiferula olefinivorans]